MARSQLQRTVHIGVAAALVASSATWMASPAGAATRTVPETIGKFCDTNLRAILAAYSKKQFKTHASLSAGLTTKLSQIPLSQLETCELAMARAVRRGGTAPFITVLIEHGYRLGRMSSQPNGRRFAALQRTVAHAARKEKAGAVGGTALIRVSRGAGYRPYSGNAGFAVLAMSYSKFGKAQYAAGAKPEQMLRVLELYRQCREAITPPQPATPALTVEQVHQCDALAKEIADSLPGAGGGSPPMLADGLRGGITRGTRACLAAEDKGAQVLAQFESYTECRRDEQMQESSRSGFSPNGMMIGSASSIAAGSGIPQGASPLPTNLQLIGESHTSGETVDGGAWMQDDFSYSGTDAQGNPVQVDMSRSVKSTPGQPETEQTRIAVTNSEGMTEYFYEGTGGGPQRMTGQNYEGSDGSTYTATFDADGNKTEVVTDGNGNEAVIETDAAGHQTFVVRDESGNIVESGSTHPSGTASTTLPPGEEGVASGCTLAPNPGKNPRGLGLNPIGDGPRIDRGSNASGSVTGSESGSSGAGAAFFNLGRLGPWINPNPDAAPVGAMDSCLTSFVSGQPAKCPPSVALCVNPPPPGSCGCSRTAPLGSLGRTMGTCAMMNCGPDGTCDPETGTCRSSSSGSIFPGVRNPPKKLVLQGGNIRFGAPVVTRPAWAAGTPLWYPSASHPGLRRVLGSPPAASSGGSACGTTTTLPCR